MATTEKTVKKLTIHKMKKSAYNALPSRSADEMYFLTDVGGQVSEISVASADYVGEIVQYVGETNDTYTNGYFYKCIETDGVYSWTQVNVQEGGTGGTGGYSEIVWDKTQNLEFAQEDAGTFGLCSLNLGDLQDGKYHFYFARKLYSDSGDGLSGYDNVFADLTMKYEFEIQNDAVIYARAYVVPPLIGNYNAAGQIFGPEPAASVTARITKLNGEFVVFDNSGGWLGTDAPVYYFPGEYQAWKVTKLVNDTTGAETEIYFGQATTGNKWKFVDESDSVAFGYKPLVSVYQTSFATSKVWSLVQDPETRGFWLYIPNPFYDLGSDAYFGGQGYVCNIRVYIKNIDTQDMCVLDIKLNPGFIFPSVVMATGVFSEVDFKLIFQEAELSNTTVRAFLTATGIDFYHTVSNFAFYGNAGNTDVQFWSVSPYEGTEEYTKEVLFKKDLAPTSTTQSYVIHHENGLVETGGIVEVETLNPDVALGNVPVTFPQELANSNFVPTITVMTDGSFKQVMADVSNPTTTGFDLCVRSLEDTAVSGIKIAWKVVGTAK